VIKKAKGEFTILLRSVVRAEERIQKYLGLRLKQAPQLLGNIRVVYCKVIIQ